MELLYIPSQAVALVVVLALVCFAGLGGCARGLLCYIFGSLINFLKLLIIDAAP